MVIVKIILTIATAAGAAEGVGLTANKGMVLATMVVTMGNKEMALEIMEATIIITPRINMVTIMEAIWGIRTNNSHLIESYNNFTGKTNNSRRVISSSPNSSSHSSPLSRLSRPFSLADSKTGNKVDSKVAANVTGVAQVSTLHVNATNSRIFVKSSNERTTT